MCFYKWVPKCWQTYAESKPWRQNSPCWHCRCPAALQGEVPQTKSQLLTQICESRTNLVWLFILLIWTIIKKWQWMNWYISWFLHLVHSMIIRLRFVKVQVIFYCIFPFWVYQKNFRCRLVGNFQAALKVWMILSNFQSHENSQIWGKCNFQAPEELQN